MRYTGSVLCLALLLLSPTLARAQMPPKAEPRQFLTPYPTPLTPQQTQMPPKLEARQRHGVIIVLGGSGDDTSITENLNQILGRRNIPIAVHTIRWCRYGLIAMDHVDYDGQVKAARRVANYVNNYRKAFPQEKIYLIGHSDGTHVVLAAADMLPEWSVDRIMLMAATVSYNYDLRPALSCSRGGVDHVFSIYDEVVPLGASIAGTSDARHTPAAGEAGFAVPPLTHPAARYYKGLRQYRYAEGAAWTRNLGGHFGFVREAFLDAYILPIMLRPDPPIKYGPPR